MAENITNIYYGSGIGVAGNIDIGAIGLPADSRVMVKSIAGLQELQDAKRVYDGMIVYCEDTHTYHKCRVDWDSAFNITSCSWTEVAIKSEEEIRNIITATTTAAMEFKGATNSLPASGVKGDMYKISGSFTVAAENDAEEKGFTTAIGDSIVYDGAKWYLIPSGDDIEDTWRPITNVDKAATLTFSNGDYTTAVVEATGTIKINHNKFEGDLTTEKVANTDRTYLVDVDIDEYGHVVGYKTATETVVDTNTEYEFEGQGETSSVFFTVKTNEEDATPTPVYLDAYTQNEADGKFVAQKTGYSLVADTEITKLAGVSEGANKVENVGGGKIKIDGQEVTVYAHPDKHTIADVDGLQNALDSKVASVSEGNASVTVGGTATAPTVAVKISAAEGNALTLDNDGLKVIIPESTKVEASTTNGNIKVDGEEVTVYTHPEKHTVSEITDFAIEVAKVKVDNAGMADSANTAGNAANLGGFAADAYLRKEEATGYADILTKTAAQGLYRTEAQVDTQIDAKIGDLGTAVQNVTSVEGNGIKATRTGNDVVLDWDTDVVFVFNAGSSTTVI